MHERGGCAISHSSTIRDEAAQSTNGAARASRGLRQQLLAPTRRFHSKLSVKRRQMLFLFSQINLPLT